MTPASTRLSRRIRAVARAALAALVVGSALLAAAPADAGESDDGVGLTIPVVGPSTPPPSSTPPSTPPPSTQGPGPSPSPGPGSGSGPVSNPPGAAEVVQTTPSSPAEAAEALGDEPFDNAGALLVGGLTVEVGHSPSPAGGDVVLRISVKNISESTIDLSTRFWVETTWGSRLVDVDGIETAGLEPGQTRTIETTIHDLGQWAILTGHATVTPPDEVDGAHPSPVTRDATFFLPPYFTLLLLALLALALVPLWIAFVRRPVAGAVAVA